MFAPMLTKMFSRNSKNSRITSTTKTEEKSTTTAIVSTTTTETPMTDEVVTLTTTTADTNTSTRDDNEVLDPTNWLEIEKIHPKRRKIVSRRNKKEKMKNDNKAMDLEYTWIL